jgi:hypothetical protein
MVGISDWLANQPQIKLVGFDEADDSHTIE